LPLFKAKLYSRYVKESESEVSEARSRSRTFYLRLRNPAYNNTRSKTFFSNDVQSQDCLTRARKTWCNSFPRNFLQFTVKYRNKHTELPHNKIPFRLTLFKRSKKR